jgi:hypothetical protein
MDRAISGTQCIVLAGFRQGLQIAMTSLLVIDAIISSLEATQVSLACFYGAVVLCLPVNFSLMAIEVWFVSEGAVVACWIVACEASVSLFRANIS